MRYIVSATFEISAIKKGILNRFSGLSIRSLLYNKILASFLDAESIHEYKGLKPFSVSPIYDYLKGRPMVFDRGSEFQHGFFKVNFLSIKDYYKVIDALTKYDALMIDGIQTKVLNIEFSIKSYNQLVNNTKVINEFTINFITPTSIRASPYYIKTVKVNGKRRVIVKKKNKRKVTYLPIPQPNLLFKSILRQLRKFSGLESFPFSEISDFIESDGVFIKGYDDGIRTRLIKISPKEMYLGFVGKVTFRVDSENEYSKFIYTLLHYAEYCNIGVGRTAGFGWIKTIQMR